MMKLGAGAMSVAITLIAVPSWGHHSHAMFDDKKTLVLAGTVKELQWTNPHSWLQVMVADERGVAKEWSLEMGAPAAISRRGWKPKTLLPGDKVSVTIHPLKDGNPGGSLLAVKLPNGTVMGEDGGYNP